MGMTLEEAYRAGYQAGKLSMPEIVRCKECINNGTSRCPCHYSGDPHIDWEPDDNWFCADGERR